MFSFKQNSLVSHIKRTCIPPSRFWKRLNKNGEVFAVSVTIIQQKYIQRFENDYKPLRYFTGFWKYTAVSLFEFFPLSTLSESVFKRYQNLQVNWSVQADIGVKFW